MAPTDVTAHSVQNRASRMERTTEETVQRALEIEEASNRYFIHRISLGILPGLIRLGVSPNAVSFMGALSGLAAAWSYYHYESSWACVLGLVFMVAWHVFDGADGQLARTTGKVSPSGFVVDGACDYLTFIFVYGALGLALSGQMGSSVWLLALGAAVSHAVQAAAFEMQRESYLAWVHRPKNSPHPKRETAMRASSLSSSLTLIYRAVQEPFQPLPPNARAQLLSSLDSPHKSVGNAYQHAFRRTVLAWSILSANNRTIAIFILCLMGQPLFYFLYELVVLNIVLLALIHKNHVSRRTFARSIVKH